MQNAMDIALPYVHTRKQFGTPIGEFQVICLSVIIIRTC